MAHDPYSTGVAKDYSILNVGDRKYFKPNVDGPVSFDIVPFKIVSNKHGALAEGAKIGDELIFASVHVHSNVGPHRRKVICPNRTWGGKCPICEYQQTKATELGWKHPEVKELFPKNRLIMNLIDIGADTPTQYLFDVAQFKGVNPSFFDMVSAAADTVKLRKKLKNVYWANIDSGMTIECSVKMDQMKDKDGKPSGEKFPTFFNVNLVDRKPYDKSILDKTVDPMTLAKIFSYDEIEKLFYGADNQDEDTYSGASEEEKEKFFDSKDTDHGMGTTEPKEEIKETPKTIGVRPADDKPECKYELRFGRDWNKDPICKDCDEYISCKQASKALAQ